MSNLILHCGAQAMDRTELGNLPMPAPKSAIHQPIHHADFLFDVTKSLASAGYFITEEAFGCTGDRFFGLLEIGSERLPESSDYSFTVGLRGSHDRKFSRGISLGSRVFVCDNLAFNGETVLKTKHTTNIEARIPKLIDKAIGLVEENAYKTHAQFESYRNTWITDATADAALTQLVRMGCINASEIGKTIDEWDEPTYPDFAERRDVWRLFNAATETLKPRNPEHPRLPHLAPKTKLLHALCDELVTSA